MNITLPFNLQPKRNTNTVFIGILTGNKTGKRNLVCVLKTTTEAVNIQDAKALEDFINDIDTEIYKVCEQTAFMSCALSQEDEIDLYLLIDATEKFKDKNCILQFKTGQYSNVACCQTALTNKRKSVLGIKKQKPVISIQADKDPRYERALEILSKFVDRPED